MTTPDLTAPQQMHVMCLTYLKLRTGRLLWEGDRVDAFLENFAARCEEAGTTPAEALRNAALVLEQGGRGDFLPQLVSGG